MRTQYVILGLWIILHLILLFSFSSSLEDYYRNDGDPAMQSSSCNAYVHQEELMEDGANNLSGLDLCRILQELSNEVFRILPDYQMNNSHFDSGELGPFVLGDEITFVHKSYTNVRLVMQNMTCNPENSHHKTSGAKVSAVFRVIAAASEDHTQGASGLILPAEGAWDSSTGRLCMIGLVPKGMEAQVSMYFPRALSIRQRSIVFGTISSSEDSFYPLHFDVIHSPYYLELRYGWYVDSYLSYNYSNIKQADKFRRRESFNILRVPEKFVLRYPTIQQEGGLFSLSQIHDLTDELYVDTKLSSGVLSIKLELVSLGLFLARYDFLYMVNHQGILEDAKYLLNKDDIMNVSLHLTFSEDPIISASTRPKSVTFMFLEGVYDPRTGKMYLIGCGKVDTGVDVERGLDCLIKVKVQYAPTNYRWLRDPTVQMSITSQRNKDDALYFSPIELQSNTIPHHIFQKEEHEQDVAFRKIFEGALRVVALVLVIVILWSQKLYMERNLGSALYVSLHMLACEILGYSLVLITGGEMLFPSKETISYTIKHAYDLHEYQPMLICLSYTAKLLASTAIFLNIRLFCKISETRKRQSSLEPSKTPLLPLGDRQYVLRLLKRFATVILGGLTIIIMLFPAKKGTHSIETVHVVLTHLGRTLHDIWLLAQIIDNWHSKNQEKSLRKVYYIGLSVLTIMLKIYDRVRTPVSAYLSSGRPIKNLNLVHLLYSDIEILGSIILVIIIYIQQSFNYFWIINCFNINRLLNLRKLEQILFKSRDQPQARGRGFRLWEF